MADKAYTQEDEGKIVSEVLSNYQKAYKSKMPKELLFREAYMRYRSYLEVSRTSNRSTLFIPESFSVVETVAPRMTAQKPSWVVLPRESSDIQKAESAGQLLDYFYERTKLNQKLKIFVKQALIYGTSFLKVGWDTEAEIPTHDPIDVADIFGDPSTYDWQSGFLIHRYYSSVDELKRSKVTYKNLDKLESREHTQAKDDLMRQSRYTIQGVPYISDRNGFEMLEQYDYDEDGKVRIRVIADREVCVRDELSDLPLDRFPIVPLFDQSVPFERWGIGEIEPIIDLQDEENTTRNQRIDEKNLSIHNMWVVSKLAGIDYKKIVSKPGGLILANDINGIKPLEKQNITQDSIAEINLIKQDIQNTTGVNDYVRGTGGTSTATETISKTHEANLRFSEKVGNLEIALKEIGEWDIALAGAFMTKQIQMRVMSKFGITVRPMSKKDFKGMYDIDIETGSSLPSNPELRRQQLITLTQVIAPLIANPNGIPEGLRELVRTVIDSFDMKNTDEILRGANPPQVSQALANLTPDEMQNTNPQMVEAEIKRILTGQGAFAQPQPEPSGSPSPANPVQGVSQPIPQTLQQVGQ